MKDVNALIVSKTLNSGVIFFNNPEQSNKWKNILEQEHVRYVKYVLKKDGNKYYGFRMFRMKKQFFRLCVKLKEEVLECYYA